jgi:hypothetical protein
MSCPSSLFQYITKTFIYKETCNIQEAYLWYDMLSLVRKLLQFDDGVK